MRSFCVVGLFVVGAVAFGCSSSDAPAATSDAAVTGSGGGGSQLLPDGGCPDPTKILYQDTCLDPAAATAKCEADTTKRYPGIKVSDNTCGAGCTCSYCAGEMALCATDAACAAIVKCANDNNCISTACYVASGGKDGPCRALIDHADNDAGLSSNAVGLAQLVNACATKTKIGTNPANDYTNRQGPVCNPSCM